MIMMISLRPFGKKSDKEEELHYPAGLAFVSDENIIMVEKQSSSNFL